MISNNYIPEDINEKVIYLKPENGEIKRKDNRLTDEVRKISRIKFYGRY